MSAVFSIAFENAWAVNTPIITYCSFKDPNRALSEQPESGIPDNPSAPPKLAKRSDVKAFGCKREFLYQGKVASVDSYHRQDGERLRPILKKVPSAVNLLNEYQDNKRSVRTAAYTGSLGLVIMLGGLAAAGQIDSKSTQILVRNLSLITGLGILSGSVIYSVLTINANEDNLFDSVKKYNVAKPKDKILLQFSTSLFKF